MVPWTVSSRQCNVCKIETALRKNDLHLCSGCRLVRYCGSQHQRLDWEIHKPFCVAVKQIIKERKVSHILELQGPITSWTQFDRAVTLAKFVLISILGRELERHEVEFLSFPIHCEICFTRGDKNFISCSKCNAVSYCNEEHQKQDQDNHSKWCNYLYVYYNFYEVENCTIDLDFEEAPIFDSESVPDDLFTLIETTAKLGKDQTISRFPKTLVEYQSYAAVCTFSCVATILDGIFMSNLIIDDNDVLTIYIIGALNEDQFLQLPHCAFLSSQLPTIKTFNFYLIGPEVDTSEPITFSVRTHKRDNKININFCGETFENFAQNIHSSAELEKMPHMIVAFNCGFYENAGKPTDTWKPGIKAFFQFDRIPILFTSYTLLESRLDLREFSVCANELGRKYKIIVNTEESFYRDYRPFRNMELIDRDDLVYFQNGYMQLVIIESKG
ncbi:unnamed protein product [Hermetia illucens]|uniref:MYND-type domain-containing protein n=1 Tax=Hermetia illucens TaxID=343691 RepID=A0A7R8UST3_HERIL|nr:uncharacterized protein LOC119651289 [Hermetia illucens]XP_037910733.1 uncharacterized protein LOC119651289 [Hermetia illucens]XP_037910734.1 uncharacterized protein LOC119651289 [Hermetia illucens]CAD7086394.1 unnamed protein product [Hermetia illucens]